MSGKSQTVTISEEEYRRLHEVDMRVRFSAETGYDTQQQITALQDKVHQLEKSLAATRALQGIAQPPSSQVDETLRQRLQIAARLAQALQQAGYQNIGYEYVDPSRKAARLQLIRHVDGSRINLIISRKTSGWRGSQGGHADDDDDARLLPINELYNTGDSK